MLYVIMLALLSLFLKSGGGGRLGVVLEEYVRNWAWELSGAGGQVSKEVFIYMDAICEYIKLLYMSAVPMFFKSFRFTVVMNGFFYCFSY